MITAPNIFVGDYTYYDDADDPTGFERNNVLFNWPEFGDRLVIGRFCQIASGAKFIMGPANHRLHSVTPIPSMFSAARGSLVRPTTFLSCRARAIPSSATTCGSAAKA